MPGNAFLPAGDLGRLGTIRHSRLVDRQLAPPGGELPVELISRASLFVETRDAFAPTPVGSCELDGIDPQTGTELGEMLLGLRPGRTGADQVTVYKAMGVAMEDLVAGDLAYREAVRRGLGRTVAL